MTDRAHRLGQLNRRLLALVPPPLAAHVTLAVVREGCLVLQADGAAWAAQLRYKSPEILARLRAEPDFAEVRSIRVRNVKTSSPAVVAPPAARMSRRSAEALEEQAACTGDAALRAALMRLARRVRKE